MNQQLLNRPRALHFLQHEGVDGLLATTFENVYYLSNVWMENFFVLPRQTQGFAIVARDQLDKPIVVGSIGEVGQHDRQCRTRHQTHHLWAVRSLHQRPRPAHPGRDGGQGPRDRPPGPVPQQRRRGTGRRSGGGRADAWDGGLRRARPVHRDLRRAEAAAAGPEPHPRLPVVPPDSRGQNGRRAATAGGGPACQRGRPRGHRCGWPGRVSPSRT